MFLEMLIQVDYIIIIAEKLLFYTRPLWNVFLAQIQLEIYQILKL